LILATLYLLSFTSSNLITLNPTNSQGEEIAIILLHGALISNEKYVPLGYQLQKTMNSKRLWVSLPSAILQIPFNIAAYKAINESLEDLKSKGFPENGKIYLCGHSLGGFSVAEYAYEKDNRFAGLILLGATLQRQNRSKHRTTRVLTIGGELDGLMRITRMAEEFYHNCFNKVMKTSLMLDLPVVIIKGLNHIQFANGEPSDFVAKNDLKAEISLEESHLRISELIEAFVTNNNTFITNQMQETLILINPIITAYEMEGSIHFNRPEQTNCVKGFCGKGSEWIKRAQWILSGMEELQKEGFTMNVENSFVELDSLPPLKELHHPRLIVDPVNHPKQINITTCSQNNWKLLDRLFDGGFDYTSSNEIGTKLYSRQCTFIKAANKTREQAPDSIDSDKLCSDVNKDAYKWALNITGAATLERYMKYGQKYKFVNDSIRSTGFTFSYFLLEFNENYKTGEVEVCAPSFITTIDYPVIPIFAPEGSGCYHYCKFISPARVIEWIYVDSLRKNYRLN